MHSTVYLPLLSVAFYLGSRLTKSAVSQHLKILQMASRFDYVEHSSVHNLLSEYEYLKSETTKIWVCSHSKCDTILKTQKNKDNLTKLRQRTRKNENDFASKVTIFNTNAGEKERGLL